MKKLAAAIVVVLAIGILVIQSIYRSSQTNSEETIMVFCAAGIKKPVLASSEQYTDEFGTQFQLQYGGTGTLLSQLQIAGQGDIFIAADDTAVQAARDKGLVKEIIPLARQYPVIAVPSGNPKGIASLDDLLKEGTRVAIGNPEAASIGKATKRGLGEKWDAFSQKVAVMKPTVTEIAADLKVGAVDAAVIWNSTVPQFEGLEAVRVPEFDAEVDNVSATVLASCKQPATALRFARYLSAPKKGGQIFQEIGFETIEGDEWAVKPELILYSGGVNRPAVEQLLTEFAEREDITLTTIFNGCGILCTAMQTMSDANDPKFPDAYYACDVCFVPPVAQHFEEVVMLTETEIGIAVREGNPKGIKSLIDLTKPGLKVGICNQEQSTIGFMTDGILRSSGLNTAVRKNVVVEVPTADFLINQMRAGSLDAAIVYRVNAQLQEDYIDFLTIRHKGARAVQPFSIWNESPKALLAGRLQDYFLAHPDAFIETGFVWRGDEGPIKSIDIEVPPWLLKEDRR